MIHINQYMRTDDSDTPTFVILHGLFGSADNWAPQARMLSDRFRVIVPDLPDHGTSDHCESITIPGMVSTIGRMMGENGYGNAHVLGHSLGGKVAMGLALTHPELVASLVVADISPKRYQPRHTAIFTAMRAVERAVALGEVGSRGAADRVMEAYVPDRAVRAFLLKNLVPGNPGVPGEGGYRWRLNLTGLSDAYEALSDWSYDKGTYTGPTLFIRAGLSPYMNDADLTKIHAQFPRAIVETMSGVGHWLHAEDTETFVSVVRRFIS